jgi:trans-aconitate 2-methyltransferase
MPLPHLRWGDRVLAALHPTPTDLVLDAGCGTGRDTAKVLDIVTSGRVIALDRSSSMLRALRSKIGNNERLEIVMGDLGSELDLNYRCDAAFSVAALHWVKNHQTAFSNLFQMLKPGGRLVFDCGGRGNIASIEGVLRSLPEQQLQFDVWNFAGVLETKENLANAGFTDITVDLIKDTIQIDDRKVFEKYISTLVLPFHLAELRVDEQKVFLKDMLDRLPSQQIDYVRLFAKATRPSI